MAGCDYLKNIPNFGIGWAYRYVQENATIERVFEAIDSKRKANGDKMYIIPTEYIDSFGKAKNTFKHQVVFDIVKQKQTRLNKAVDAHHDLSYAGKLLDQSKVKFFIYRKLFTLIYL